VLPGFTPSTLGEVYEYFPSPAELKICLGIAGAGVLVFTLFSKVAIPLSFLEPEEPAPEAQPPTAWPRRAQTAPS
jgi:molybdopterin-containing oxidoreductase family membrane subunit